MWILCRLWCSTANQTSALIIPLSPVNTSNQHRDSHSEAFKPAAKSSCLFTFVLYYLRQYIMCNELWQQISLFWPVVYLSVYLTDRPLQLRYVALVLTFLSRDQKNAEVTGPLDTYQRAHQLTYPEARFKQCLQSRSQSGSTSRSRLWNVERSLINEAVRANSCRKQCVAF